MLSLFNAIITEIATNTTTKILISNTCFFSAVFFNTVVPKKSIVIVELDVSTNDESVDIEADNTNTITIPINISGSVESIVGIIESYPPVAIRIIFQILLRNNIHLKQLLQMQLKLSYLS